MVELAVEARGLVKRFGPVPALAGVDLHVPAGTMLGLLGPNGAGKTTAVRILTTLLPPDAGTAAVMGFDVRTQPRAVRSLIGLSGQYATVDGYLTGRENLHMIARLVGLGRAAARRRADQLLELLDLTAAAGRTARTYSGGMRRRLDLAASLVANPAVLFLDEPTTGLDPRGRIGLWQLLEAMTAEGTSVLLTTQYLEEADRLADQVAVLDHGQVIAAGTPAQLKARIGGQRIELQVPPGTDPQPLAAAMAGLGTAAPTIDPHTSTVLIPVSDGQTILPELAARLAATDLPVSGLALRSPTLEDAFLALTGNPPPAPSTPDNSNQLSGGPR